MRVSLKNDAASGERYKGKAEVFSFGKFVAASNEKKSLNYANGFDNGALEPQKFWSHSKVALTKDARVGNLYY